MTRTQIRAAADFLRGLRASGTKVDELPEALRPASIALAYEVQRELIELLGADAQGWFVALTSVHMQRAHGGAEPIYGRILRNNVLKSRADVGLGGAASIEAEIGFRMRRDMAGRAPPITLKELTEGIESVVPVIEIVEGRFNDLTSVSLPSLVADNGTDGVVVVGEPVPFTGADQLADCDVALRINGNIAATGHSSHALGNPLHACRWLAQRLHVGGDGFRAGDLVITGNCLTRYSFARPDDEVEVTFGELGGVSASLRTASRGQRSL
jgi:2-keto-4-pentenoate hydratase